VNWFPLQSAVAYSHIRLPTGHERLVCQPIHADTVDLAPSITICLSRCITFRVPLSFLHSQGQPPPDDEGDTAAVVARGCQEEYEHGHQQQSADVMAVGTAYDATLGTGDSQVRL
jgi:hypothetical protein